MWVIYGTSEFQSTLPLRGATLRDESDEASPAISIHTPLAGSDLVEEPVVGVHGISIHTPLAGSDCR